jgi:hypothetical protein
MLALENGHVVPEKGLRPEVPLGVRDADPLIGADLDVFLLRPTRRRKVRILNTAVAAHRIESKFGERWRCPVTRHPGHLLSVAMNPPFEGAPSGNSPSSG